MAIYKIQKIIDGKYIGQPNGLFVAVPDINYNTGVRYDDGRPFTVCFGSMNMIIPDFKKAITYRVFTDKQNRGKYTLGYFNWRPE